MDLVTFAWWSAIIISVRMKVTNNDWEAESAVWTCTAQYCVKDRLLSVNNQQFVDPLHYLFILISFSKFQRIE